MQNLCEDYQLDIRDKSFATLNSLDRILVDVQSCQLEKVSEFSLRNMHILAVCCHILPAQIVLSIAGFVDEHMAPSLTFTDGHWKNSFLRDFQIINPELFTGT